MEQMRFEAPEPTEEQQLEGEAGVEEIEAEVETENEALKENAEGLKADVEAMGGEEALASALQDEKNDLVATRFEDRRKRITRGLTSLALTATSGMIGYGMAAKDILAHASGPTLEDAERAPYLVGALPVIGLTVAAMSAYDALRRHRRVKRGDELGL